MQNDSWGDEKVSTKNDSRQMLQGNPFELIRPPESTLRKRNNSIQEDDLEHIRLPTEKKPSQNDEHKLRRCSAILQERKEISYLSVTSPYKDDSPQGSSRTLRNPPVPEFVSVISHMREGSDRCLTSACEDTTMLASSCWFKKRYTCIFMFMTAIVSFYGYFLIHRTSDRMIGLKLEQQTNTNVVIPTLTASISRAEQLAASLKEEVATLYSEAQDEDVSIGSVPTKLRGATKLILESEKLKYLLENMEVSQFEVRDEK